MDVDQEYESKLKKFIVSSILPMVIAPNEKYEEHASFMVAPERMSTWIEAFTDYSYNPNIGKNYERLECLGDAILDTVFNVYLSNKISTDPAFATLTNDEMTQLLRVYMSEPYQTQISIGLGLKEHIRSNISVDKVPLHDIFESLVGAIYTNSVKALYEMKKKKFCEDNGVDSVRFTHLQSQGDGFNAIYNFLSRIFHEHPIDRKLSVKGPINQIKEIYTKIGWAGSHKCLQRVTPIYDENVSCDSSQYRPPIAFNYRLVLPRHVMESLVGIVENPEIANETAPTHDAAELAAYTKGVLKLQQLGVTEKWASQNQAARIKSGHSKKVFDKAFDLARSHGYVDVHVSNFIFRGNWKYMMLLARTETGGDLQVLCLVEAASSTSGKKMAIQLVESYLSNNNL